MPADLVAMRYRLTKLDGTQIENSDDMGQPFVASTDRVFPGFGEAMAMMQQGGRYRIWLPPGQHAQGPLPPGTPFSAEDTLVFDVTVLQVAEGMAAAQRMMGPQGAPGGGLPGGLPPGALPPGAEGGCRRARAAEQACRREPDHMAACRRSRERRRRAPSPRRRPAARSAAVRAAEQLLARRVRQARGAAGCPPPRLRRRPISGRAPP